MIFSFYSLTRIVSWIVSACRTLFMTWFVLRLLPREDPKYIGSALRAIKGVIDNINEKGELERVSFGTPVFDSPDEYKQVKLTSMPYGQSCALLALTEYLRLFI